MVVKTLHSIEDMKENFKVNLKYLRLNRFKPMGGKKPTQARLAEALGVDVESVKGWEQGKFLPEFSKVLLLSNFFNVDIDYLFGRIDKSRHDTVFICDTLGLSETAVEKLIAWNENLTSNNLDTRHWIRFISEMIEDASAETFLEKLHSGILNELQTQPIGDVGIYPMIQAEQPAAFHDATLFALSRISSDIVERIIKNALSRA